MEIEQLILTSISLTLRTQTFLYESDDIVPLDTPIIVLTHLTHIIDTLSYELIND